MVINKSFINDDGVKNAICFAQVPFVKCQSRIKLGDLIKNIRGHSILLRGQNEGGRGSKNVCFCPRSVYKNCPSRGGGQKTAKIGPRSC